MIASRSTGGSTTKPSRRKIGYKRKSLTLSKTEWPRRMVRILDEIHLPSFRYGPRRSQTTCIGYVPD